jgi:hypothetical protein
MHNTLRHIASAKKIILFCFISINLLSPPTPTNTTNSTRINRKKSDRRMQTAEITCANELQICLLSSLAQLHHR